MSHTLQALMTKLNWQLQDLKMHLDTAHNKALQLQQQIQDAEMQLNQVSINPLLINPELEINRLNFITQQHEQKEILISTLKTQQDIETKLQEKIQRVKTELKMLEKYLQRDEIVQKQQQQKTQDNALDEWAIQRKEL